MNWVTWPVRIGWFAGWLLGQVVLANVRMVATILLHPRRPSLIVAVPTRCASDTEVALLAISVSLPPGSMVLATEKQTPSADRSAFVVYVYGLGERDELVRSVQVTEQRLLAAVRREAVVS